MRREIGDDIAVHARKSGQSKLAADDTLERALHNRMREAVREGIDQTLDLDTTSAVRFALGTVNRSQLEDFAQRTRLLHAASRALRRLLVDHARRCKNTSPGTGVDGDTAEPAVRATNGIVHFDTQTVESLLALDAALKMLRDVNPRWEDVAHCTLFGRMNFAETSSALQTSPAMVKQEWALSCVWLYRCIEGQVAVANAES